ncbi:MAG: class I SAM-dependent methyltransferase [Candidatus Bathyarchaeota archaeon]
MAIWWEVEDALEAIIDDYEKVNHVISFFQDDKTRILGLKKIGTKESVVLELGSGPGNFTQMIRTENNGEIICLDYSEKMINRAREKNNIKRVSFVRGIFEKLPIRGEIIDHTISAYALRDSKKKVMTYGEIGRVLREHGKLILIDIGKPNNRIIQGFFSLYMRFLVPIMAGLAAGYGFRNPWSILYKTYELLPSNQGLRVLMNNNIGRAEVMEISFGGLVVAVAEKTYV